MPNNQEAEKLPSIDLTKIKNLDAVAKTGDRELAATLKSKGKQNARKEAKRKFNFSEASVFELPSNGKFYQDSDDEDLRRGLIKLLPMGLAEEEILTNRAYHKNSSMFRVLFDTCMESDYPAKKLLSYDVLYLVYCLRQITYGEDYKFDIKCGECDKSFSYDMNISEIDFKELEETQDARTISLPVSKYSATLRLLRLADEEEIARLKNSTYADDEEVSETILNLFVRTVSIQDEKGNEISPDDWIEFYTCLPVKDKLEIKKSFEKAVNDPKISVVCPKCGNVIKMSVPFDSDFFRIA